MHCWSKKKQKKKVTFQTKSNKQSKSKTDINKIEPTIHGGDKINTRYRTRIKSTYQKNTGPMIKEMSANKPEDRIIAAYRMQEYIENAAYIIKQTGNKEDMISLIFELENLITATGIVRSQIHRWKEADDLRYDINEYASRLKKAEIQEAILGGEWILRNNRQVKTYFIKKLQIYYFRPRMTNMEGKIINIETFPDILRNHLKDALKEAVDGPIKDLEKFDSAVKQLAMRDEVSKLKKSVHTIDLNSPTPRNLEELYKDIEDIVGEVGLTISVKKININLKKGFYELVKFNYSKYKICKWEKLIYNIFRKTRKKKQTWLSSLTQRKSLIRTTQRKTNHPSGSAAGREPVKSNDLRICTTNHKREPKKIKFHKHEPNNLPQQIRTLFCYTCINTEIFFSQINSGCRIFKDHFFQLNSIINKKINDNRILLIISTSKNKPAHIYISFTKDISYQHNLPKEPSQESTIKKVKICSRTTNVNDSTSNFFDSRLIFIVSTKICDIKEGSYINIPNCHVQLFMDIPFLTLKYALLIFRYTINGWDLSI